LRRNFVANPANDILDTWEIGWDELIPDDPDEPKPIGDCVNCGKRLYEEDPHVWTGWIHSVLYCKTCDETT
jgi:hypothetical protein